MAVRQYFTIDLPENAQIHDGNAGITMTREDAEALYNDLGEALWGAERPSVRQVGRQVIEDNREALELLAASDAAPVIVGQTPGTIGGPSSPEMGMPESNVPLTSLEDEARALMAISAQYGGPTKTLEEWMEDAAAARGIVVPPMAAPPPPEAHVHSQLGSGNDVGSARGGSDTQRSA